MSVRVSPQPLLTSFPCRLHDQMVKINQSLHRLQVAWREAQQSSSPAADSLREQFERLMTIYLSTKTAMTEPQMLQNCLNLQVSMAVLLVQLAVGNRGTEPLELSFPLPEVEHSALAFVPGEATGPAGGLCQHLQHQGTGRAARAIASLSRAGHGAGADIVHNILLEILENLGLFEGPYLG